MRAVWGVAFYVYHTGDNSVERIMLSNGGNNTDSTNATASSTFDLTKLVDTSKYLYGGYYEQYSGIGTKSGDVLDTAKLEWVMPANASAVLPSGVSYPEFAQMITDGKVCTAKDENATAYTGENVGMFTTAYEVHGSEITPVAGAVYYIKEVPAADFLQPRLRYTYKASEGNKIGTAWLFTNMDEDTYSDVGFMIGSEKVVGDHATSVTITPNTVPGNAVTYDNSMFKNKGTIMSYKMVYNVKNLYGEGDDRNVEFADVSLLQAGQLVSMFWVTPDGMIVTSTATRTYSDIETTSITMVAGTVRSTITVYSAS